jgi:hypothetical protein
VYELEQIKTYQYLWDGSQPGWVLNRLYGHYVDLSLTFSPGGPSNGELMAVRRTVLEYKSRSLSEVVLALRGRQALPLGRFLSDEAREIATACRHEGLAVLEDIIETPRYVLRNEITGIGLLIEDNALKTQVCAAAVQNGVPVRHLEF